MKRKAPFHKSRTVPFGQLMFFGFSSANFACLSFSFILFVNLLTRRLTSKASLSRIIDNTFGIWLRLDQEIRIFGRVAGSGAPISIHLRGGKALHYEAFATGKIEGVVTFRDAIVRHAFIDEIWKSSFTKNST
jgi:hypothetical protein